MKSIRNEYRELKKENDLIFAYIGAVATLARSFSDTFTV